MSETAESVIKSALQDIMKNSPEVPAETPEVVDGIVYLNRMMLKFAATGIDLGYTVVASLADTITVPDGAVDGIVSNLAIRLHPQYTAPRTPISAVLLNAAKEGEEAMLAIAFTGIGPATRPDTQPIGSGNEGDWGCGSHFYSGDDTLINTENGGVIATETDTEV